MGCDPAGGCDPDYAAHLDRDQVRSWSRARRRLVIGQACPAPRTDPPVTSSQRSIRYRIHLRKPERRLALTGLALSALPSGQFRKLDACRGADESVVTSAHQSGQTLPASPFRIRLTNLSHWAHVTLRTGPDGSPESLTSTEAPDLPTSMQLPPLALMLLLRQTTVESRFG
jgi:hypothetical protein